MSKTLNYELRCYVFVNKALSPIQKGVQGTHATIEMLKRYRLSSCMGGKFTSDWQDEYKTLIFLDGGFHQELLDNYEIFSNLCVKLGLPHSIFIEDEETMNNMATAFAGIIPENIYNLNLEEYWELEKYSLHEHPMGSREMAQLKEFTNNFKLAT